MTRDGEPMNLSTDKLEPIEKTKNPIVYQLFQQRLKIEVFKIIRKMAKVKMNQISHHVRTCCREATWK